MVDLHANRGKASIKAEGNIYMVSAEMMLLVDRFYYELKERESCSIPTLYEGMGRG